MVRCGLRDDVIKGLEHQILEIEGMLKNKYMEKDVEEAYGGVEGAKHRIRELGTLRDFFLKKIFRIEMNPYIE